MSCCIFFVTYFFEKQWGLVPTLQPPPSPTSKTFLFKKKGNWSVSLTSLKSKKSCSLVKKHQLTFGADSQAHLKLETYRAPRLWMLQTEDNISFFGLTDLLWTCPATRRNVAEEWILWPLQDQFIACVGPCTINYHPSAMFLLLFFFSIISNQRWQISVCAYHNTWFFVLSNWRTLKDLSLRTIMMKFIILGIDGFIR